MHHVELTPADDPDEDVIGLILMRLQGQYAVGICEFIPAGRRDFYASMQRSLNTGSIGQRQRFIILAADLAGSGEAARELRELDELIAEPPDGEPVRLSEEQATIQQILQALYPANAIGLDEDEAAEATNRAITSLSADDRELLVDRLGWFGSLALAPSVAAEGAARAAVLHPARFVALALIGVAGAGALAGLIGFVFLVLLVVFTATGRLRSALGPPRPYNGIYAETFAVWMVVFLGLQILAGWVAAPGSELIVIVIMFFLSLVALGWPVVRGIPWPTVRQDIGLIRGPVPWLEPWIGLGAYVATIPLLAAGLLVTLGLMFLQNLVLGEPPTFAPGGGPAHPVIAYTSDPAVWPKVQLLLLAAVAAPIVEETMFRGVLYRHLRDVSAGLGVVWSVLLSVAISGFIFASIHPQGFVAIPALMSLACGMALVREWRGTLVPSMVLHGVSNGLIMSILMIVLGV